MRQLLVLAWKELREVRWVWGFALVVFIALPLIGGIEGRRMSHRVVFEASPFVNYLGGVLAIVVAATSVCRDLEGSIVEFWRSRAVSAWRWMGTKYGVGVLVVLIACMLPLALEEWNSDFRSSHTARVLIAWLPFVLAAQYSLGFLCACLMPRPARAVMLALALSLLTYCLPVIFPPLSALYIPDVLRMSGVWTPRHVPWVPWPVYYWPARQLPFVAVALALTVFSGIAALLAVSRNWGIESVRGLTHWSIAFVFLLLFASAAFQLATNLPILQTVDLTPSGDTVAIYSDGRRGVVLTGLEEKGGWWTPEQARAFEITPQGIRLGPAICRHQVFYDDPSCHAWLRGQPNLLFSLHWTGPYTEPPEMSLVVLNLSDPSRPASTINFGSTTPHFTETQPQLIPVGDRLYASWNPDWLTASGALVDVSDVNHLMVSPAPPFSAMISFAYNQIGNVALPPVQGVPPRELLDATVVRAGSAMQGNVLAKLDGRAALLTFELMKLSRAPSKAATAAASDASTGHSDELLPRYNAEFSPAGRYDRALIEQVLGFRIEQIAGGNGYVYLSQDDRTFGTSLPSITVLDVSDPTHPRPVGHFAAPEAGPLAICPLPGGRLLAGGHKLYLLGPPPGR